VGEGSIVELNLDRVRTNVSNAATDDLMDRVTIYREGMEPKAVKIVEDELIRRGVTVEQVEAHLATRKQVIFHPDGAAIKCSFCHNPAVTIGWGWHRLFGVIPVFPRQFAWCEKHRPTLPGL
jgi:hypothetical protein